MVGADRDAAAARQGGEARGLLRPDDVIGQLDVLEAGVEVAVPAGELDHLLGDKWGRRGEGGCKKCRGDLAAIGIHGSRSFRGQLTTGRRN